MLWLLEQMTPKERHRRDVESAFLETLYPELSDADFETRVREADRRIEPGLMPTEDEIMAMCASLGGQDGNLARPWGRFR